MCRIAGIVNFSQGFALPTEEVVTQMCELQKHGGPDDSGIYSSEDAKVTLGNRRLSLLDMSMAGHMPMSYQDKYYITYNGEVYNFKEIKEELKHLGHMFSTGTDTEVIMAAYAQWGVLSFSKLRGMFAFALWDRIENEVLLVRDPVGIKQLYYGVSENGLVFSSELRAFQAVPGYTDQHENWPVFMMAYGHIPEPITTLKKVRPLTKGCFMKYHIGNKTSSFQSYMHYSFSEEMEDLDLVLAKTRIHIEQSVKRHLIADAPIGVFLSGGLDSSIITSIASKFQQEKLKTLSIFFDEKDYSEKDYQDILIQQLHCGHHQFLLKEEEFHDSFQGILNSMDMPSCDGINTWFISKYAASMNFKAVLSGLGGDELFGGYPSFSRMSKTIALQQMPDFIKNVGNYSSNKVLNRISYLKLNGIKGIYLFLRGHFTPNIIARQLGDYENNIWKILDEEPNYINIDGLNDKNQASWIEFNLYMQNQLLRDADIMSMIHGVELRVPFLDHDLIRFANAINPKIKYRGDRPKQLLIDIFNNQLPVEIWNRKKMGFSFPFQKWLSNSDYIREVAHSSGENFQRKYTQFISGKLHWSQLLSLVILKNRKVLA